MTPAALGYGLFAAAALLLFVGSALFAILALTRAGDAALLGRGARRAFLAAGIVYVGALCALAGYFVYETLAGRMEWQWIVFGPVALASLVVLDLGLYRKLVEKNLPTWERFRGYIRRADADPAAMRRTLADDVVLHRSLLRVSPLRWLRHTLIFWGFAAMTLLELGAVMLREAVPAFGWRDIWRVPGHPVRLAYDFAFDFTGLMILAGCLIALGWRIAVNARPERKYADTPATLFLLFVVASGFVLEAWRIAPTLGDPAHAASFVGLALAHLMPGAAGAAYKPLWIVHALAACGFIAYVPLKRMVHTCATPVGRLMVSQRGLLEAKRRGSLAGMLIGKEARS
jgi:hypothetical protein